MVVVATGFYRLGGGVMRWRNWRNDAEAVVLVACTYFYFLLFAQFGFLERIRSFPEDRVLPIMGAMAVAGIAGSLAAGKWLGRWQSQWVAAMGFLACAGAALASVLDLGWQLLVPVGAAIGAGTGIATVAVATLVPERVREGRMGTIFGLGTGLAYLGANVPGLFTATPQGKALAVTVAVGTGAVICLRQARVLRPSAHSALSAGGFTFGGSGWQWFALSLLSLMGLVWFDSAAFVVVQQTNELKDVTWGSGPQLWRQGLTHLVAAVVAGQVIDRGRLRTLMPITFGLFATAFTILSSETAPTPGLRALAAMAYACGISLYSVALVSLPGWGLAGGRLPARWRAALLFAVAGWFGSTQGIGMARHLQAVPPLFILICGALVLGAWAWTNRTMRLLGRHFRRVAYGGGALGLLIVGSGSLMQAGPATDAAKAGRRVYVAEGCINCHSQYHRPGSFDEEAWGPAVPLDREAAPVLIGNRRQGPDLSQVGARRSRGWLRLHMLNPQALAPGSRMPSYRHLFGEGDPRGEQLVDYLTTLRSSQSGWERAMAWTPPTTPGDADHGQLLFAEHCAGCHGGTGRGDGTAGRALAIQPADLTGTLRFVPPVASSERTAQLLRVIRFGIPGTEMPGHETLTNANLADLGAYVEQMQQGDEQ